MPSDYLTELEVMLKMWGSVLKFAKPYSDDLLDIWDRVLSTKQATVAEVKAMAGLGCMKLVEYPVPAEGLELLRLVREHNDRQQIGNLVKARLNERYNCMTTPDQVRDGQVVERGQGNGVAHDELEHAREVAGLPRKGSALLTVRQRLKALTSGDEAVIEDPRASLADQRKRGGF